MNFSTRNFIFLVLISSILLAACSGTSRVVTPTPLPTITNGAAVSAEGRIVPREFATLAFATGGEIESIAASEGQRVDKGDILASLGRREPLEAALQAALLEQLAASQALDELNRKSALTTAQALVTLTEATNALNEAQKAYNDINTDAFQDELDKRETAVQDRRDDLKDAQDTLDKYVDLDPDNQTRKNAEQDVEDAQRALDDAIYKRDQWKLRRDLAAATLELARAAQADAQSEYDLVMDGPNPDDLALVEARVANADAQVEAARRALANMDLLAPFDGLVADLHGLGTGEWVAPAQPVVTLLDDSAWYVETKDLSELDIARVMVGQRVSVLPDALDVELEGVVESISPVYTEKSGDVLYTVRIRLENSQAPIRWGMTVTVEFLD